MNLALKRDLSHILCTAFIFEKKNGFTSCMLSRSNKVGVQLKKNESLKFFLLVLGQITICFINFKRLLNLYPHKLLEPRPQSLFLQINPKIHTLSQK